MSTKAGKVYSQDKSPLLLKELIVDAGIKQIELALAGGVKKPTINVVLNRFPYIPETFKDFKKNIENFIKGHERAMAWLRERNLEVSAIWNQGTKDLVGVSPAGSSERRSKALKGKSKGGAMIPGDPNQITVNTEVEMLTQEATVVFKLKGNPFINDVRTNKDIYMSDEHRYIQTAMLDASRNSGFLAVIGEVGSGKSTMRRKVIEELQQDGNTLVIYPQIIDKTRLSAASICDAIIMDLSEEKPKMKLEAKTRQVTRLLLDRRKAGYNAVLIIEEAQDLTTTVLKYLKRFHEIEDNYQKLLGIVLIGQTELNNMLSESTHSEMREVIRRIQKAEIKGLNGNIEKYLKLKFHRVGGDIHKIFAPGAIKALGERLTDKDNASGRKISYAHPLVVNNYAAKAMNEAAELGEKLVTVEIMNSI